MTRVDAANDHIWNALRQDEKRRAPRAARRAARRAKRDAHAALIADADAKEKAIPSFEASLAEAARPRRPPPHPPPPPPPTVTAREQAVSHNPRTYRRSPKSG